MSESLRMRYTLTVPDREGLLHTMARRFCRNYWGDWRYDPGEPQFAHYYERAERMLDDLEAYASATANGISTDPIPPEDIQRAAQFVKDEGLARSATEGTGNDGA